MRFNKKTLAVFLAVSFSANNALAENPMMTVGQYEKKAEEIYQSNLEFSEKSKQLKDLESLWDIQQSLLTKMLKAKIREQQRLNPQPVEPVQEKKPEIIAISETNDYIRSNMGWDVNTVFLSDLIIIGNDAKARILVNGESKTIDLNRDIKLKRVYAGNLITGFEHDGIYVKNLKTNKTKLIYTTSETAILEKIKFNNELAQEYAKSKALGELDIHFEAQSSQNKGDAIPLPSSYPTVIDSLSAK